VQDAIEAAIRQIAQGVGEASGTRIEVEYVRYYPATVNTDAQARIALHAAECAGLQAGVAPSPAFTSEDFAFMLQARPGAYLWLGQGARDGMAPTPALHHPSYDFNDEALAPGIAWFVNVAHMALA